MKSWCWRGAAPDHRVGLPQTKTLCALFFMKLTSAATLEFSWTSVVQGDIEQNTFSVTHAPFRTSPVNLVKTIFIFLAFFMISGPLSNGHGTCQNVCQRTIAGGIPRAT